MNIRCNQIILESKIYHYEIDIKTTQWITWLRFCKRYLKAKNRKLQNIENGNDLIKKIENDNHTQSPPK